MLFMGWNFEQWRKVQEWGKAVGVVWTIIPPHKRKPTMADDICRVWLGLTFRQAINLRKRWLLSDGPLTAPV